MTFVLISDANPNHKRARFSKPTLSKLYYYMVHVSALSFCVCACVYLCALHSQKPQKSCSLAILRICCAALSFFFFELSTKEKRALLLEGEGSSHGMVWWKAEKRGVASSRLSLWENIKQKNTKNYHSQKNQKAASRRVRFSLSALLSL